MFYTAFHDNSCQNSLQLYNRHTACSFLKQRFQQKYDVVHFVGDSLTRNHFFGLMTILMVQESVRDDWFFSRYFPEVCTSPECCLGFQKIWLPAQNCSAKFYEREICGVTFKYSWFDSSTFPNILGELKQAGEKFTQNFMKKSLTFFDEFLPMLENFVLLVMFTRIREQSTF